MNFETNLFNTEQSEFPVLECHEFYVEIQVYWPIAYMNVIPTQKLVQVTKISDEHS